MCLTFFFNHPAPPAIYTLPLPDALPIYGNEPAPKGEIVVVIGPPINEDASEQDIDTALRSALKTQSVKDAAKEVAEALDLPRKQLYARALELK